jgi:hypothetical protein
MKKSEEKWNKYLIALTRFAEEKGHTDVPASYSVQLENSVLKLGNWTGYIKARGRNGKLSEARRNELESIPGWTWEARRPGPCGDAGRDQQIALARKGGRSLQSIAVEWNLSRQRVHQIVRRMDITA